MGSKVNQCDVIQHIRSGDMLGPVFRRAGCSTSHIGFSEWVLVPAYINIINGEAQKQGLPSNFLRAEKIKPRDVIRTEITKDGRAYVIKFAEYTTTHKGKRITISFNDEIKIIPLTLEIKGSLKKGDSNAEVERLIRTAKIPKEAPQDQLVSIRRAISEQAPRLAKELSAQNGWGRSRIRVPEDYSQLSFQLVHFRVQNTDFVVFPGDQVASPEAKGKPSLSAAQKTEEDRQLVEGGELDDTWTPKDNPSEGKGKDDGKPEGGAGKKVTGEVVIPEEVVDDVSPIARAVIEDLKDPELYVAKRPSFDEPAYSELHIDLSYDLAHPTILFETRAKMAPEEHAAYATTTNRLGDFLGEQELTEEQRARAMFLYTNYGYDAFEDYWTHLRGQASPFAASLNTVLPAVNNYDRKAFIKDFDKFLLDFEDLEKKERRRLLALAGRQDFDEIRRLWRKHQREHSTLPVIPVELLDPYYQTLVDIGAPETVRVAYLEDGYEAAETRLETYNKSGEYFGFIPYPWNTAVSIGYDAKHADKDRRYRKDMTDFEIAAFGNSIDFRTEPGVDTDLQLFEGVLGAMSHGQDKYLKDDDGNFLVRYSLEGMQYLDFALADFIEKEFSAAQERTLLLGPDRWTYEFEEPLLKLKKFWDDNEILPPSICRRNALLCKDITLVDFVHEYEPSIRTDKFPVENPPGLETYSSDEIDELDRLWHELDFFRMAWQGAEATLARNLPINNTVRGAGVVAVVSLMALYVKLQMEYDVDYYGELAKALDDEGPIKATDGVREAWVRLRETASRFGLRVGHDVANPRQQNFWIEGTNGDPMTRLGQARLTRWGPNFSNASPIDQLNTRLAAHFDPLFARATELGLTIEFVTEGYTLRYGDALVWAEDVPVFELDVAINGIADGFVAAAEALHALNMRFNGNQEATIRIPNYWDTKRGAQRPTNKACTIEVVYPENGNIMFTFNTPEEANAFVENWNYYSRWLARRGWHFRLNNRGGLTVAEGAADAHHPTRRGNCADFEAVADFAAAQFQNRAQTFTRLTNQYTITRNGLNYDLRLTSGDVLVESLGDIHEAEDYFERAERHQQATRRVGGLFPRGFYSTLEGLQSRADSSNLRTQTNYQNVRVELASGSTAQNPRFHLVAYTADNAHQNILVANRTATGMETAIDYLNRNPVPHSHYTRNGRRLFLVARHLGVPTDGAEVSSETGEIRLRITGSGAEGRQTRYLVFQDHYALRRYFVIARNLAGQNFQVNWTLTPEMYNANGELMVTDGELAALEEMARGTHDIEELEPDRQVGEEDETQDDDDENDPPSSGPRVQEVPAEVSSRLFQIVPQSSSAMVATPVAQVAPIPSHNPVVTVETPIVTETAVAINDLVLPYLEQLGMKAGELTRFVFVVHHGQAENGQTFPIITLRSADNTEGPTKKVGSVRVANARPGAPLPDGQATLLSGSMDFGVRMGLNVVLLLPIEFAMHALHVPHEIRMPIALGTLYGMNLGLHKAGLIKKPTIGGFLEHLPAMIPLSILASAIIDKGAKALDLPALRSGTITNNMASITIAISPFVAASAWGFSKAPWFRLGARIAKVIGMPYLIELGVPLVQDGIMLLLSSDGSNRIAQKKLDELCWDAVNNKYNIGYKGPFGMIGYLDSGPKAAQTITGLFATEARREFMREVEETRNEYVEIAETVLDAVLFNAMAYALADSNLSFGTEFGPREQERFEEFVHGFMTAPERKDDNLNTLIMLVAKAVGEGNALFQVFLDSFNKGFKLRRKADMKAMLTTVGTRRLRHLRRHLTDAHDAHGIPIMTKDKLMRSSDLLGRGYDTPKNARDIERLRIRIGKDLSFKIGLATEEHVNGDPNYIFETQDMTTLIYHGIPAETVSQLAPLSAILQASR